MRQLSLGLKKLLLSTAVVCMCATTASAATKQVTVGPGVVFTDVSTGTSNPAVTTINVGDTVVWNWAAGSINHSTTSGTCSGGCAPDGIWDSPTQSSGSFSHTFNTPGTFHYFCRPHQAAMQGMVVVNPPPDFAISVSNPNGGRVSGPIFPSQQTIFDGSFSPVNGYNNTVNLSCIPGATGVPTQCSPNPASAMVSSATPFTIAAGAATPGHYDFGARGTDGTITHSVSGLNFDVVDFGITSPAPSSLTAFPGTTTISTSVNLTAAGNFSGSVSVACGGLPTGAACNFTPPGPYFPTVSTPVTVNLTVTVPAATTLQDYNVVLSAVSATNAGSVTKNQSLTLRIIDFNVAPLAVTAFTGSTSNPTFVNLTAGGTFSGTVALSCSAGLPPGATCGFSPSGPYSPTASTPVTVTLTIAVPVATATQDYNVTLSAVSGGVTKNGGLTLRAVSFAASAFSPTSITIGPGNISNAATTQLTASANFTGVVTLACTAGLPPGGTCNSTPSVVSSFPSSASVRASVPTNTAAGAYTLTITAAGALNGAMSNQTLPLTLNVPTPDFSLGTPSPATVTMINNSFSQPVTVLITPLNFSGTVTLGCGNLPTGVTCLFSPATSLNVNGSPSSFAVVFAANGATPNSYAGITITGTATINGTPATRSISLTQLNVTSPASSTTITSSVVGANSTTNSTLINVGDPNLSITVTVNNTGVPYSAAVWEVSFSSPVVLVASSNPNCSQILPTVISCNIGDVPVGNGNAYSFKVAPLFGRSVLAQSLVTSPTVGSTNLAGNQAQAAAIQVRPRPLARRGLVPKTP